MKLSQQFPEFTFVESTHFLWRPSSRTIEYDKRYMDSDRGNMQILHEIGHALLNHQIITDETRYRQERDAWDIARILALKLGMPNQELLISRQLIKVKQLGYEAS